MNNETSTNVIRSTFFLQNHVTKYSELMFNVDVKSCGSFPNGSKCYSCCKLGNGPS